MTKAAVLHSMYIHADGAMLWAFGHRVKSFEGVQWKTEMWFVSTFETKKTDFIYECEKNRLHVCTQHDHFSMRVCLRAHVRMRLNLR